MLVTRDKLRTTTSYFDADPDMVLFAADASKKLLVLHKYAGGTLLRPYIKLVCLLGAGANATTIEGW